MTEPAKDVQARAETSSRRAQKKAARDLSVGDLTKGFSPIVVGIIRGMVHAAIMAALTFLATTLTSTAGGAGPVAGVAVVGVGIVRSVEGILDKLLGAPAQARLLGGKPVGG